MKAHLHYAFIHGAESIAHDSSPNATCRAILCYLFEEIIVSIEEEGYPGYESLEVQSGAPAPVNVLDSITQRECQLLQRRRSGQIGRASCRERVCGAEWAGW